MNIQFQEIQYFPLLVFVFVVGIIFHLLLLSRRVPLPLNIAACLLLAPILISFTQQKTMVDDQTIHIQFGLVPIVQYTIPLKEITGLQILTYVKIGDFWGVRRDGASMPPLMAGIDEGLVLELSDGSRYLIGSQRVKELQQAIEEGGQRNGNGT